MGEEMMEKVDEKSELSSGDWKRYTRRETECQ